MHIHRCVSEVLTAVSILSSESLLTLPFKDELKPQAAAIHRRFAVKEGDLPTLMNIYDNWLKVISFRLSLYCQTLASRFNSSLTVICRVGAQGQYMGEQQLPQPAVSAARGLSA